MQDGALTKLLHIARVPPQKSARSVLPSKQNLAADVANGLAARQYVCSAHTQLLTN